MQEMSSIEIGHPVKVLDIVANNRYELNEKGLSDILLKDGVRDRPVVVVSVAGGYRRGKSFILDYFLRYLKAPAENKSNGSWLGDPNEPLRGFSWRGGSQRETTGIVVWSEPIHATMDDGVEVVVLLMDTQGTFDSSSTIRDCSTVFAMSTLVSSVQIYNLSMNINEDDLQHLQLFTEYGRLAKNDDDETKAFQVLQFLVRDWPSAYEFPYGAKGGRMFLDQRLKITDTQVPELRELREHIHSCFEQVNCFLMPHPGLNVRKQDFNGSVGEILEEFRESLLELAESIFSPKKLVPKMIAGRKVKGQDLFEYFKTYMTVVNSDQLPTPVSILKATAQASMLMAMRESRELYEANMERECGPLCPSVPPEALLSFHNQALQQAVGSFTNRKHLGPHNDDDVHALTRELENRLLDFVTSNDSKTRKASNEAMDAYDDHIKNVNGGNPLFHPEDLEQYHGQAMTKALEEFDASRRIVPDQEDEERNALLKHFEQRLVDIRTTNERNNEMAVAKLVEEYSRDLDRLLDGAMCASPGVLQHNHKEFLTTAIQTFKAKRNLTTDYAQDVYEAQLIEGIETRYATFTTSNSNVNRLLVHNVMNIYNNHMASVCTPIVCLHPSELWVEHGLALAKAKEEFIHNRVSDEDSAATDEFKKNFESLLSSRYQELCHVNVTANKMAVDAATSEYCRIMDSRCRPSLLSLLIIPLVVKIVVQLPEFHAEAKKKALEIFWSRRRPSEIVRDEDEFFDTLKTKLHAGFLTYCDPVMAVARELNIHIPLQLFDLLSQSV